MHPHLTSHLLASPTSPLSPLMDLPAPRTFHARKATPLPCQIPRSPRRKIFLDTNDPAVTQVHNSSRDLRLRRVVRDDRGCRTQLAVHALEGFQYYDAGLGIERARRLI